MPRIKLREELNRAPVAGTKNTFHCLSKAYGLAVLAI
jgi:hypothetical protein